MRILAVEDEAWLADALRRCIEADGHVVDVAGDGSQALELAKQCRYDAVLLDVMLPGVNGFQVCRSLREQQEWVPIVMITARDSVADRIRGLDSGADDYVVKPFAVGELMARLRAVSRRAPAARPVRMSVGDLELCPASWKAWCGEVGVELSVREFRLLEYLMMHPGMSVDRMTLLRHVWGSDHAGQSNVVDVYIGYLRKKLRTLGTKTFITTVRGVGYGLGL